MSKHDDSVRAPLISSAEFDKEDRKSAVSVFSRCHNALFNYILISSVIAIAILAIVGLVYGDNSVDIFENSYFAAALQIVVMYFITFPIFYFMVRNLPKAERDKSTIGLGEFISLCAMCLAIMQIGIYLSMLATHYLGFAFGAPADYEITYSMLQAGYYLPTMIWTVIFAPIFEELIFRKLLIDRLSVYGDTLAVIVTAFAFGLFHGNIAQFFYATLAGLLLGHVYTKTRRLIYSILIHMVVNLFGTLPTMLYYVEQGPSADSYLNLDVIFKDPEMWTFIVGAVQSVLILFGLVMLVVAIFNKKFHLSRECDIEIPKLQLLRVVVFNSGTLLFVVYSLFSILSPFLVSFTG